MDVDDDVVMGDVGEDILLEERGDFPEEEQLQAPSILQTEKA